jgi:hypothetical protein
MHTNDYFLECYVRDVLDEARAAAARAALVPHRVPAVRPRIAAMRSAVRSFFARATPSPRLASRPR